MHFQTSNMQRSINSTLTRDSTTRPGSALNNSSSKNLLLQHKIEGITSQLTSIPGTQTKCSPIRSLMNTNNTTTGGGGSFHIQRQLSQNMNTLNIQQQKSLTSLTGKTPSQRSFGGKHMSLSKSKNTESIRLKVNDLENNVIQLKENIDRKHTQSVASDKKVEKILKSSVNQLSQDLQQVKHVLSRLSDTFLQEFDTLRDDFQADLQRQTLPLYHRLSQVEITSTQRVESLGSEVLSWRASMEERVSGLRVSVEEELRREIDRVKTMVQSQGSDFRLRAAKVDEDINVLDRQVGQMHLKQDVIECMRKTMDLLEQRTHEFERYISDHDVKLAAYYSRYDRLNDDIRELRHNAQVMQQPLKQHTSQLDVNALQTRLEQLIRDTISKESALIKSELAKESHQMQALHFDHDKKLSDVTQGIEKLQQKLQMTEKLTYDFRRDLAKNMNEIENAFAKRLEQVSRAVTEVSKMQRINYDVASSSHQVSGGAGGVSSQQSHNHRPSSVANLRLNSLPGSIQSAD